MRHDHHHGGAATLDSARPAACCHRPRAASRPAAAASPGAHYTCPMHPEVRSEGPGSCPKCGMDLEAITPVAAAEDHEFRTLRRRFSLAAILSLPLLAISMGGMLAGTLVGGHWAPWIEFALATPVVLGAGFSLFARAFQSLRRRSLNMYTLIGLGVGAAYGTSVLATVAPSLFPPAFRGHGGHVGLYYETAAVVTTLVLLGQLLEVRARRRAGAAVRGLLDLAPKTARRIEADGTEVDVATELLRAGDRLRVRPGEAVPADGIVLEGESHLDESSMTGEPLPVAKVEGDAVIGGTLNGAGSLVIEARKVGTETLLSRIVALVLEAQRSPAPVQRLVDRISAIFVPAVLVVAALAFAGWLAFGGDDAGTQALLHALAVLIIACPCALGLAAPMSIIVATGRAANAGILFKNAEAIERLQEANVLLVDKTGTLTEGRPTLVTAPSDAVLTLAASLERGSEHPLSAAIFRAADARGLPVLAASRIQSTAGRGISGIVAGWRVALGNEAFMDELGVRVDDLARQASALRENGETVVFIAVDGKPAGLAGIADPVRTSTPEALEALQDDGIRVVMLTGDSPKTAAAVARRLGIEEVIAGVLPDEKQATVRRFQRDGHRVAVAGDGVNDAPALAAADVGIAMGHGSDIALESAGVTLVNGDLRGLARARRIAAATMRNLRTNLVLAFAYNALAIPVAAGVFLPLFGLSMSPMLAAAAMSLSSVSVIANALRLRGFETAPRAGR